MQVFSLSLISLQYFDFVQLIFPVDPVKQAILYRPAEADWA